MAYLALVFVSAMLSLGLRYYGVSLAENSTLIHLLEERSDLTLHVTGDEAVYRISFVLCLFFVAMLFITLCSPRFHRGFWGVKLVLYVAAITGSVFIPNDVFDNNGYAWFARVASVLFLVLQIVAMIDFAYNWNDSWVDKAQKAEDDGGSGRMWYSLILVAAGCMFLVALGGIILTFAFLSQDSLSTFFTTATLVLCVGFTFLQLFAPETDGSLLSSAIVTLYCVYLNWSAISSNPNETGSIPVSTAGSGDNTATMILGMAVAGFSLAWTCYSGSLSFESVFSSGKASIPEEEADEKALRDPMLSSKNPKATGGELRHSGDLEDGKTVEVEERGRQDADSDGETMESKERFWVFHLFLATGCVYMAMLFTDWGSGDELKGGGGGSGLPTKVTASLGQSSMWIKICSQWLTIALYTWTLLAARCCPNREFN